MNRCTTSPFARSFVFVVMVLLAHIKASGQPPHSDLRVARWDVILNETGLESVDSADHIVVHTPSIGYSAAIFKADELRAAVNAATAIGGLEGGSQSMSTGGLYFNYVTGPGSHVGLQGGARGTASHEALDDEKLHLKLNYKNFAAELCESESVTPIASPLDTATIIYDGQLRAEESVAFSATIKNKAGSAFRHMIVWEVYQAKSRYQYDILTIQDSERWVQLGPKGIINAVDVSNVWSSHAKHRASSVAAGWEQKLEDGKVVRLIGLSRNDKWFFCWWDADGQTISHPNSISFDKYFQNQSLWFDIEVAGPGEEWKKQTPTNHPPLDLGQPLNWFAIHSCNPVSLHGRIRIGVPVGPWQQLGEIIPGDKIKVGYAKFVLQDVRSSDQNDISARFYDERGSGFNSDLVTLSAMSLDGNEIDAEWGVPQIVTDTRIPISPNFHGVSLRNLKSFHVWKRKLQWVNYTGFATEPMTPPKDQVSESEIEDAPEFQR